MEPRRCPSQRYPCGRVADKGGYRGRATRDQVPEAADSAFGRGMRPEQRGLRNAAAGQKDLLPEPTDPAFELDERAHEPLRIAGQICCGAVGVLLARARKAELDQRHEGGREGESRHAKSHGRSLPGPEAG